MSCGMFLAGLLSGKRRREKAKKEQSTLEEDIPRAADWLVRAMASSGYRLDGTVESFRELDRFFEEQHCSGGLLDGRVGDKLFAIGSYMGQVFCKELSGIWETDGADPQGEVNIAVRLRDGAVVWPVQRAMKRHQNGLEDGLYAYGAVLAEKSGESDRCGDDL